MKTFTRRITSSRKDKKSFVITLPVSFIKKLELDEKMVELKIKDGGIIIKKISVMPENSNTVIDSDDDDGITYHH